MRLGVCWYPEQEPEAGWAADVAAMADTGLELVRIGEFAWSAYEPATERWDWGWLDRALELLGGAGLSVVLGTPTATPPVWLLRERPELLSVGPDGRRRAYGSRRHTCPTVAAGRQEARRVTTALARRYGGHPAVVAWQVDNEPGNHDSARCWCDACAAAFPAWLAARYGTVEALNAAWGTAFWSQTYPSFHAVALPVPAMTDHNPALELAHRRFATAQVSAGLAEQRAVLTGASPGRDVFTNLYLGDLYVDAREVARPTGLAAFDNYPHGTSGPEETAYILDLARGLSGRDGRVWIAEQQPGPVNWTPQNPPVPPGQVRAWGWQAAMHGVEALLLFRWRAARFGQEIEHAGLLRHDGTPARGLAEARALAADLVTLAPLLAGGPRAEVALLHAYDDAWLIEIDPHRRGLTHRDLVLPAHTAARRLGFEVDVVAPTEDLTGYAYVLAPGLCLATPERLAALESALDTGATVILGPRSLVRDADGAAPTEPVPAGLSARLGARVAEGLSNSAWPQGADPVTLAEDRVPAGPWIDVFEPGPDAEVLARYGGGTYLDGAPAAVRRGGLVAVGCSSAEGWLAVLARVTGRDPLPPGAEHAVRGADRVVLDHRALRLTVHGPAASQTQGVFPA